MPNRILMTRSSRGVSVLRMRSHPDYTKLTNRFQGRDFRLTDVAGKVVRKLPHERAHRRGQEPVNKQLARRV